MWKLELDEDYFRIYDTNKRIAGYFDPDYGEVYPKEKEAEIIEQMHKNRDKIRGGFLMMPMLKFGIFDSDYESDIASLDAQLDSVNKRLVGWKGFLSTIHNQFHTIRISHTDQDMLTITFQIQFSKPTPLEKSNLLEEIIPTLDLLQKSSLL